MAPNPDTDGENAPHPAVAEDNKAQLKAFAASLGRELDRVGYPTAPARTNQLSQDLGLGKMQAYRIGRGKHMPGLPALLKLHSLGVSFDVILSELQEHVAEIEEIPIHVQGLALKAMTLPAEAGSPFVVSRQNGLVRLRELQAGETPAKHETPIWGLRFTKRRSRVAVIEDDQATLDVLCRMLEGSFQVSGFQRGRDALANLSQLESFDAFVVDWRLPDIEGSELIEQIRRATAAPIVLTTAIKDTGQEISNAMHAKNIEYVAKPIDGDIIRAMLERAIEAIR